ncbi:MAG: TolB family protein [Candidatus Bruticola sp.]
MVKTVKYILSLATVLFLICSSFSSETKAGPLSEIILFACKPYKYFQIYAVRPDGKDITQVLDIRRDCREPNLCSKTNEIVFSMFYQDAWNLYITDLQGSFIRRLTSTAYNDRHPVWSPDGSQIAFSTTRWGHVELATINADGSGLRRLTHNGLINDFPVWSPDGNKIAFVSWKRGWSHIYVINMLNGSIRPILNRYQVCVTPAWSPDSVSLLFRGRSYFGDFLAYVDGKNNRHQFRKDTEFASYPAWSPNGEKIIFSDNGKHYHRLTLLDPNNGQTEPFAAEIPARAYDLVWQKKNRTWEF